VGPAKEFSKPRYWKKMLSDAQTISRAVAEEFRNDGQDAASKSFLRVDFFGFASKYTFAEVTFAPGGCGQKFLPAGAEAYFGHVQSAATNIDPELAPAVLDLLQQEEQQKILKASPTYSSLHFTLEALDKARVGGRYRRLKKGGKFRKMRDTAIANQLRFTATKVT